MLRPGVGVLIFQNFLNNSIRSTVAAVADAAGTVARRSSTDCFSDADMPRKRPLGFRDGEGNGVNHGDVGAVRGDGGVVGGVGAGSDRVVFPGRHLSTGRPCRSVAAVNVYISNNHFSTAVHRTERSVTSAAVRCVRAPPNVTLSVPRLPSAHFSPLLGGTAGANTKLRSRHERKHLLKTERRCGPIAFYVIAFLTRLFIVLW